MKYRWNIVLCLFWLVVLPVRAAPDLEVNTPAISAVKASMQARHGKLLPLYSAGVLGIVDDGFIQVRDAGGIPLPQRGEVAALVKDENTDRSTLYREVAAASGHPEWEGEIRKTFGSRWMDKALTGWYIQKSGAWQKK